MTNASTKIDLSMLSYDTMPKALKHTYVSRPNSLFSHLFWNLTFHLCTQVGDATSKSNKCAQSREKMTVIRTVGFSMHYKRTVPSRVGLKSNSSLLEVLRRTCLGPALATRHSDDSNITEM